MAYEDAPDGRHCADRLDVHHRYVTEINVFGAIGNSEELPARYHAAVSYDHERPALGYLGTIEDFRGLELMSPTSKRENFRSVDGQGVAKEWQSGATISRLVNPEWKHTGCPNLMLCTQADGNDSTLHDQLATPYDGKRSWLGNRLLSGPWNPLGLLDHRSGPEHVYNAMPFISVESPTRERTVGSPRYDGAWAFGSYRVATTSTSRPSCAIVSQGRIEDQSTLDLPTKRYDQPSPFQGWSGDSVESARSRLDERDSGNAATSAEVSGWPYHNNLSNLQGPQRGQQYLLTPTYAPISPLATDMSRVSSTQKEERLYCPEFGCSANFRGIYAKGNLARHRRLKHGGQQGEGAREYNCDEPGCSKSYQRQDARVKHYRKHHHHLAPGLALSRKKYRSV